MKILVTGGAGYIGTHTCVELLAAGHEVVVLDNFCNSRPEALRRVERIAGRGIELVTADVRDEEGVSSALRDHGCSAVVHLAGLKAVGESVADPLAYYDNNLAGTLTLLRAMRTNGVRTLVFSSSATVYGEPQWLPLTENHPLAPESPYGRTKMFAEEVLRDLHRADPAWRIGILRYFNPVGAHPSGLIGEDPTGVPNNLMPFVAQVAVGRREHLNVWGDDYPTPDGTGVRDYIHVVDLARGHLRALERLSEAQCFVGNLGTGVGYSVLDVVQAFEKASGRPIPYAIGPRREGDVASYFADPTNAAQSLGWYAEHGIDAMCADQWRWQHANPDGFALAVTG
jgi:UDP-glucose 4-epimerase